MCVPNSCFIHLFLPQPHPSPLPRISPGNEREGGGKRDGAAGPLLLRSAPDILKRWRWSTFLSDGPRRRRRGRGGTLMDSIVAALVGQRGQKSLGCLPAEGQSGGWGRGRRRKGIGRIGFGVPIPKERKMGRWTRDTLISVGTAAAEKNWSASDKKRSPLVEVSSSEICAKLGVLAVHARQEARCTRGSCAEEEEDEDTHSATFVTLV